VTPDLTTATGREWARLIREARAADKPARKPRAKRFTGLCAQRKAWLREQAAKPGIFFGTGHIPNWLNVRMHHHAKAVKAATQRRDAFAEVRSRGGFPVPPLVVTITRYGPRVMDDDGLAASLKHYRDGVADALCIDDGDTGRLRFVNRQETAKFYGLRIVIESGVTGGPQ
jgi:hypothetical protein